MKINKHNVDLYLHEDANIDRTNKRNIVLFPIDYFKVESLSVFILNLIKERNLNFGLCFYSNPVQLGVPFLCIVSGLPDTADP